MDWYGRSMKERRKADHYLHCCRTSFWMSWIESWSVEVTGLYDMRMIAIFTFALVVLGNA
jgi:hypothetical protein